MIALQFNIHLNYKTTNECFVDGNIVIENSFNDTLNLNRGIKVEHIKQLRTYWIIKNFIQNLIAPYLSSIKVMSVLAE